MTDLANAPIARAKGNLASLAHRRRRPQEHLHDGESMSTRYPGEVLTVRLILTDKTNPQGWRDRKVRYREYSPLLVVIGRGWRVRGGALSVVLAYLKESS